MGSIPWMKERSTGWRVMNVWIFMSVVLFTAVLADTMRAQCIDHPEKKTALKFNNKTRFELTFFVDEDEEGVVVPSKTVTNEINVDPGEHMLRARAILGGESFWVWVINDVPEGQVCTWTIENPRRAVAVNTNSKSEFRDLP